MTLAALQRMLRFQRVRVRGCVGCIQLDVTIKRTRARYVVTRTVGTGLCRESLRWDELRTLLPAHQRRSGALTFERVPKKY